MLMPKKVKYRKQQRGRMTGKAWRGSQLAFGDFGLKVLEPGWITDRQIEAARVAMTRFVKRGGKIQIRLFPDKPFRRPSVQRIACRRENALLEIDARIEPQEFVGEIAVTAADFFFVLRGVSGRLRREDSQ